MTTIAVRRLSKRPGVKFASDGQVSYGNLHHGDIEKIFSNGPVVFGFAGSVRDLNLLQHALKVPKFSVRDEGDPAGWVVRKLIPEIRKTLEGHGSLETDKGYSTTDSELIISVKGLCGYLGSNFALCGTHEDFWAVGSGSQLALGAMTVGASPAEAVTVAGMHDVYTGAAEREVKVKW